MSRFIYNEPVMRHTYTKNDSIIANTEIGMVALMCPECFHIIELYTFNNKSVELLSKNIEDFSVDNSYYATCPKCGIHNNFIELDINIAQIINILNTKGYYTAYCCEGHLEDNTFSPSYIYFYLWDDVEVLNNYPLPDGWNMPADDKAANLFKINNDITNKTIFTDNEHAEYINEVKANWNKKKLLKDIYNWAVSLPDKHSSLKRYQYEFIKMNKEDILDKNTDRYIEAVNNHRE